MESTDGRSLVETPSYAVATVVTVLITPGFFFHGCLKTFEKWLDETNRKPLLAALEKIKEELMLFGFLSLLMGHWIDSVAKICMKSSNWSSSFYPCVPQKVFRVVPAVVDQIEIFGINKLNASFLSELVMNAEHDSCPEGTQSFVPNEILEQFHRFFFVLGATHVLYSLVAIALAGFKIYSWRLWENHAKLVTPEDSHDSKEASMRMTRLSSFVLHHTYHPWSNHRVVIWLVCFGRQFWSSINQSDYMALRLGFITNHQLPSTYNFFNYMLRSMEEEFRDIVGISIPLWIFTISCIVLGFHGTNVYFWISFFPAILILLIGTKLHVIVAKLAVEIAGAAPKTGFHQSNHAAIIMGPHIGYHQFNLRDELFWFGKPRFLLCLIQFVIFQNAFEVATYIWSWWETRGPSCFTDNHTFIGIRLTFGLLTQFWFSFTTFPLYVIVAQMGSKFKKSIVTESVRESLFKWRKKASMREQPEGLSFTTANTASNMP